MHLSVVRTIYRVLLLSGAAVLVWAGGSVVYANIFQYFEASRFDDRTISSAPSPQIREGDVIGKLEIPKAGVSVMVLEGVNEDALAIAAAHVSATPLPEARGNFVIAAHRDTFFRKLREVRKGDLIRFSTIEETYWYSITTTEVVQPAETWVMQSHGYSEITLITCFPFSYIGSAPQRFVVHARPVQKNS